VVGDFEAYAATKEVWGGEEPVGVFTRPGGGVVFVNSGGDMVSWVVGWGWGVGMPAEGVVAIGVDGPGGVDGDTERSGD
jgi:hypothetical protein